MNDFDAMGGAALVNSYNTMVREATAAGLAGYREVNRFADHASAVKRCAALQSSLKAHAAGQAAADRQGLREADPDQTAQRVLRESGNPLNNPGHEQPPANEPAATTEEANGMAKKQKAAAARAKTERTASKARGGGRRVEGRPTLAQQMEEYNALVPRALKKGVKCKVHTSTFESYEKGVKQIKKLRDAIEAA